MEMPLVVFQVLTPLLRSCYSEDEHTTNIYIPSCTSSGAFQQVQCHRAECWCVDPRGQEVAGSRAEGHPARCPTLCETESMKALKVKSNLAASAEIHIPACSEDGGFLPLQCVGSRCFCVDAEGNTMASQPTGGAVACKISAVFKKHFP